MNGMDTLMILYLKFLILMWTYSNILNILYIFYINYIWISLNKLHSMNLTNPDRRTKKLQGYRKKRNDERRQKIRKTINSLLIFSFFHLDFILSSNVFIFHMLHLLLLEGSKFFAILLDGWMFVCIHPLVSIGAKEENSIYLDPILMKKDVQYIFLLTLLTIILFYLLNVIGSFIDL